MDDRQTLDRHGNEIRVGDIVTYASGNDLQGGEVVYIDDEIPELVTKNAEDGLIVIGGDQSFSFDNVIVRQ
ncbi:hypothetical protein ACFXCU_30845 [Streptomyces virginiae]|uniref:hypothetical protein n=1 Tax=Streptomyces virginiae TaxID=1961 RepID=UPI0036C27835